MRERGGYHARERNGGADRPARLSRRDILQAASACLLTGCSRHRGCGGGTPPEVAWGVQSGDVGADRAVIWCRSDRSSRMVVEWSTSPRFNRTTLVSGPQVSEDTHFVGKVALQGLPSGSRIHYRARFDASPWSTGSFGTAPVDGRDVVFTWSADTNGQGWGIDPARGGMPAYTAMLARAPELFVHCGDTIYADEPIYPSVTLKDGTLWNNIVDPAKSHVAETLDDFRSAQLYPRRSAEVRALSAAVPLFSVWDDHEVHNNWFPGQELIAPAYKEKRVDVLAGPARRAFYEYAPTLIDARVGSPMYRVVHWGPLLDIFMLDGRTYRTPNEPAPAAGAMLGEAQAAWLLQALASSKAAWKVVACDMPIGVVVSEPGRQVPWAYDGWANENGPPTQREVELAKLLAGLRARQVKNVVWITADVHYAAAHRLDPARAAFKDFDPFWELVAGPMHATAFPRKSPDDTFGPEVEWVSAGWDTWGSPATGEQNFGLVHIDGKTRVMTITFVDARGNDLHRLSIAPTPA